MILRPAASFRVLPWLPRPASSSPPAFAGVLKHLLKAYSNTAFKKLGRMAPRAPIQLTPEQLAKQDERRLKKMQKQALEDTKPKPISSLSSLASDSRGATIHRPWSSVHSVKGAPDHKLIVKSWNLLAQTLVRRKLFPTSDCLKATQREHMLYRELLTPRADVICLQEVDRLEKILPFLKEAGYEHAFAAGLRKKHGCLIAYDQDIYQAIAHHVIHYDEEIIRHADSDNARRGASHRTKNIGSIVALRSKKSADWGLIVATTHLFWHPSYTYERTRQTGILLREVTAFRHKISDSWPCVIAGDFNFAPDDPAYALLVGAPFLPLHSQMLARSRVVHASLDPTVPITTTKVIGNAENTTAVSTAEEDTGEAEDDGGEAAAASNPDRTITNARQARAEDGLLSTRELVELFQMSGAPAKSVYDQGRRENGAISTFGARTQLPNDRNGWYEPEWTSYTHYWKTVLDYIFILDPPQQTSAVAGYLEPPTTQELEPGIPMKGVCSSDHISVCAEIYWTVQS